MANRSSNVIVNYLPQNMTDRELYSMFVTVGPVSHCRVMKDSKTGYSYGFGFVNFTKPEDAEKAIRQLNGQEIYNKRIKVSYARPPGDAIKETNLYVTNLPKHFNEQDLERLFGNFGTIVQKNVLLDKHTGMPRGVAFVRYDRREEAQMAIRNLDGLIPPGGTEKMSVRIAEEHGKQKAAYYAGWQAGVNQSRGRGDGFRGGRGGMMVHGGGMRGGSRGDSFNNHLVSYPIRSANNGGGFGALRQDRLQQRYNPISYGMQNNGYTAF